MKAHKKTLEVVTDYISELAYNEEFKEQIIEDVNLFHTEIMGEKTISADECDIQWGDDWVCGLQEFLDAYIQKTIDRICNVLDSFKDDELE